jgi:hypothetical protein
MKKVGFLIIIIFLFGSILVSCKKICSSSISVVTNAGSDQFITLPVNSAILTGTVKSGITSNTAYLWTAISGPSVPTISDRTALTTSVNDLVKGKYIFQFQATNNAGNIGIDTMSVTVDSLNTNTIILTLNYDSTTQHFAIFNGADATGSGNSPEIFAGAWTIGGLDITTRACFKFDLSELPSNATIYSAKLSLFSNPTPLNGNFIDANSGANNAMYIERITSNWDTTISVYNWFTQPSIDASNSILIPSTTLSQLDLTNIDVTNMVNAMHTTNNYGFEIRLQNEVIYTMRDFCSATYSDSTKHPELVITYK